MGIKKTLEIGILAVAIATIGIVTSGCASEGSRRSTGEFIDDAAVLARVKAALLNDPEIKSSTFKTEVERGVVTLTGYVRSEHERKKVEETALGVKGVKSIDNRLTISTGETPSK